MVGVASQRESGRPRRISRLLDGERAPARLLSRRASLSVRARRAGFTLIELAVVPAMLGVIGSATGKLLLRQQRFYRGARELLYARAGVRAAIAVLRARRSRRRCGGIWADSRDSPERQRSCRRPGEIHQARQIQPLPRSGW